MTKSKYDVVQSQREQNKVTVDQKTLLVDIDCVVPNPNQPRSRDARDLEASTEFQALVENIREFGQINAIVVVPVDIDPITCKERYIIESGERRWRAMKYLNKKEIRCWVRDRNTNSHEFEKMLNAASVSENVIRKEMSAYDRAKAIHKLISDGYDKDRIRSLYGIDPKYTWEYERIHSMIQEITELCKKHEVNHHDLTFHDLRKLTSALINKEPSEVLDSIIEGRKSVDILDVPDIPNREVPPKPEPVKKNIPELTTHKLNTRITLNLRPKKIIIDGRKATVAGQFDYIKGVVNVLFGERYDEEAFQQYLVEHDIVADVDKMIESYYLKYKGGNTGTFV